MFKSIIFYYRKLKERIIRHSSNYLFRPICHAFYSIRYKAYGNPYGDIYINPNDIRGWYCKTFNEISFVGQIKDGDWSKCTISKEEKLLKSSKYQAIVERFIDKKPWIETALFQKRFTSNYKLRLDAKNLEDLSNIYEERYDQIYHSMKTKGFLPANGEIVPAYVCIGEDGELYYTAEGNHRLYIAMVLKLNKIPVKVLKRHIKWQKYRDKIYSRYIKGEIDRKYIESLNHGDLTSLIK